MSRARQEFSEKLELALNAQANMELVAGYVYQSIHIWASQDWIRLPGLAHYCKENMKEERGHAQGLMDYVVQRGGLVSFHDVSSSRIPPNNDWQNAEHVLNSILLLERDVNTKLIALSKLADDLGDHQATDFLEGEYLKEQVESIKQVSDMITEFARCKESSLGVYLWDQNLLKRD